jgi:hypothetical protein
MAYGFTPYNRPMEESVSPHRTVCQKPPAGGGAAELAGTKANCKSKTSPTINITLRIGILHYPSGVPQRRTAAKAETWGPLLPSGLTVPLPTYLILYPASLIIAMVIEHNNGEIVAII